MHALPLLCLQGVMAAGAAAPQLSPERTTITVLAPSEAIPSPIGSQTVAAAFGEALDGQPYRVIPLAPSLGDKRSIRALRAIQRADKEIPRALDQYEALEAQGAEATLMAAVALYEREVAHLDGVHGPVRALAILGVINLLQGQGAAAKKHLSRAIALDPGYAPETGLFNPDTKAFFEKTKREVLRKPGTLAVTANVDAAVFVDGRYRGSAPTQVADLPRGEHFVRVVADGYGSWGKVIRVSAEAQARAELEPLDKGDTLARLRAAIGAADPEPARLRAIGAELNLQHLLAITIGDAPMDAISVQASARLYSLSTGVELATARGGISTDPNRAIEGARKIVEKLRPAPLAICVAGIGPQGLGSETTGAIRQRVTRELKRAGAAPTVLPRDLGQSCFDDPTCVRDAVNDVSVDAVLGVRLNPQRSTVAVHNNLYAPGSGELLGTLRRTVGRNKMRSAALINPGRLLHLVWELQRAGEAGWRASYATEAPTDASRPGEGLGSADRTEADTDRSTRSGRTTDDPTSPSESPPVAAAASSQVIAPPPKTAPGGAPLLGWILAGGGAGIATIGFVMVGTQVGVRTSATSTANAKQTAKLIGITGIVVIAAGVVSAVVGGAVILSPGP